jgi:hypothetical protein
MGAAPGQREYERAAGEVASWHDPLPEWAQLRLGVQAGWDWVEGLRSHDRRPHCFCPVGPRVIEWSERLHAWAHTDGWACPDSETRPAPSTGGLVLF